MVVRWICAVVVSCLGGFALTATIYQFTGKVSDELLPGLVMGIFALYLHCFVIQKRWQIMDTPRLNQAARTEARNS